MVQPVEARKGQRGEHGRPCRPVFVPCVEGKYNWLEKGGPVAAQIVLVEKPDGSVDFQYLGEVDWKAVRRAWRVTLREIDIKAGPESE